MIVVGGWPGRNVVGLNGRFGVRPADFAALGDFPSPFADDADLPGDATTEFVGVVQTLPASGTVVFTDEGGFSHTGAADGTYTTTLRLYTWAQGGPITEHAPDEVLTTSFGAVAAPSATLTAAATLIIGSASGAIGATAGGVTLAAAAALLAGAATGQRNASAAGVTLAAAAALLPGSASGASAGTAPGATLLAAASLVVGPAAGQRNASATGVSLQASAALIAGSAAAGGSSTAPGTILTAAASLTPGLALAPDRTTPGALLVAAAALIPGTASGPVGATAPGVTLVATFSASWGGAYQAPTAPPWLIFTTVLPSPPVIRTVLP